MLRDIIALFKGNLILMMICCSAKKIYNWSDNPKGKGAVLKTASNAANYDVWGFEILSLRHSWGVGPVVDAAGLSIRYFITGANPVHPEFQY